jgi:hypothetical protein
MTFDRGDRTYYVSDERLKAFRALSTEEKLRWVEELATFIRLTRETPGNVSATETVYGCLGSDFDTDNIVESLRGRAE